MEKANIRHNRNLSARTFNPLCPIKPFTFPQFNRNQTRFCLLLIFWSSCWRLWLQKGVLPLLMAGDTVLTQFFLQNISFTCITKPQFSFTTVFGFACFFLRTGSLADHISRNPVVTKNCRIRRKQKKEINAQHSYSLSEVCGLDNQVHHLSNQVYSSSQEPVAKVDSISAWWEIQEVSLWKYYWRLVKSWLKLFHFVSHCIKNSFCFHYCSRSSIPMVDI